ncbi:MAG: IS1380 family transposase, partial [bacterium]
IKVPLIIFAVGYNRFRGQEEFNSTFKKSLFFLHKYAAFIGLRNNGSIRQVNEYLGWKKENKLVVQPCPTTVLKYLYPQYAKSDVGKRVAINYACDRPGHRFGPRRGILLRAISDLATEMVRDGKEVDIVCHCGNDAAIIPTIDNKGLKYNRINLDFQHYRRVLDYYSEVDLAVGMRGHSQMIPFGLLRPILSIITHDKLAYFLEDIAMKYCGIEISPKTSAGNVKWARKKTKKIPEILVKVAIIAFVSLKKSHFGVIQNKEFQVNIKDKKIHEKSKRKLAKRLKNKPEISKNPMFKAKKIHYEYSDRMEAIHCGGLGAMHMLGQKSGLIEAIDRNIHLLKVHMPYHESDHIMNICYNILAGGVCLEDIGKLRENPAYMDSLGAKRIPDQTTAGDFLRRFKREDIERLMDIINECRVKIWSRQSKRFKQKAIIDTDATIEEITGQCKEGMNISYDNRWSYAPLIVSLANTREALFVENRPGNTPSCFNAAKWIDKAIDLTEEIFEEIWLRGDTDYSQTAHLDGWDQRGVKFVFGYDAKKNLNQIAENIALWLPLNRPEKYQIKTEPRQKRSRIKDEIVKERGYKSLHLEKEEIAQFNYRPTKCNKSYRMVVVKKTIAVRKGELRLPDEIRYFFYITNDHDLPMEQIVFFANKRCNHENDIEQLRNGAKALKMPTGDLVSNWAYMVIASIAWSLKSWMGLLMPQKAKGYEIIRMEFRRFLAEFINIPAQILRKGRQLWYRFVGYMKEAISFFGFVEVCYHLRL